MTPGEEIDVEKLMFQKNESSKRHSETHQKIEFLLKNYKLKNEIYAIFSHRKILGPLLVKGRKLVHEEVRRYIDPIFETQSEINNNIASVLQSLEERYNNIASVLQSLEERYNNIASVLQSLEERYNIEHNFYFLFENKFRGSREEVKRKLRKYLKYFENCKNVLDIGCGRGEFLELLKEHNINAIGIDNNKIFVEYCQSLGLNTIKADAISYLKTLDDESLDGIVVFQVIEHLYPSEIIKFIKLCYQKLKINHYLVVETVNPTSLLSLCNFFLDPTHKKPVHPETLKFIFEMVGFREIRVEYHNEPEIQLTQINFEGRASEDIKRVIEIYNRNIALLNTKIFGAQDYSVVGKK